MTQNVDVEALLHKPVTIYDAAGRPIPGAGARARQQLTGQLLERFFGPGGYAGARGDRRTLRNWHPGDRSADADTVPDLRDLRGRSRDLQRNSPIAGGAIAGADTAVVGSGLQLQANPNRHMLELSKEDARAWKRRTEFFWSIFSREVDITGAQAFGELCSLVFASELASGDVLAVRRFPEPAPGELFRTRVQLFEADLVSTPNDKTADPTIVSGVERNSLGRELAFHVANRHPGDVGRVGLNRVQRGPLRWKRISVRGRGGIEDVRAVLVAGKKRPNQARGVPYLAGVIEPLKQLERYTESELAAAVVASFFTVFVKVAGAEGLANTLDPNTVDTGTTSSPSRDLELAPGAVFDLNPGEDITTANLQRPNDSFDPFVMAVLRQVGARLEQPYEVLVKHFGRNYAAARASLMEAWRFYRKSRAHLVSQFVEHVYRWFMTEAVARGLIIAPGFLEDPIARHAWLGASWTGPAMGQLDPTREVSAVERKIAIGTRTYAQAAAELDGTDWEENFEILEDETKRRREAGLDIEPVATRSISEADMKSLDDGEDDTE